MMHCLPRGSWAHQTARSSRTIGVCGAVTIFVLSSTEFLESARVVGKRSPWLQHMGALRPDLPIEAMVKMKMVAAETEV